MYVAADIRLQQPEQSPSHLACVGTAGSGGSSVAMEREPSQDSKPRSRSGCEALSVTHAGLPPREGGCPLSSASSEVSNL